MSGAVPETEVRQKALVSAVDVLEDSRLETLLNQILNGKSTLRSAVGTLSRVLAAMGSGHPGNHPQTEVALRRHPTPADRMAAFRLLLFWEQSEVRKRVVMGKLDGLGVWVAKDHARGLVVTRGRLTDKSWERVTGRPHLPVLLGASPLARLVIWQEHSLDHRREVGAVLSATRRQAWIVDGRRATKGVVKSCMTCRLQRRETLQQRMGDRGDETLHRILPFQQVSLDLMGPLNVLLPGGRRRAVYKAWVAVLVCSTVKAVNMILLGGYDTDSLLVGLSTHCAVYGHPSLITTDQGTQLRAAADISPNWDQVQFKTAHLGTAWKFVPPGTPWRNGLAE